MTPATFSAVVIRFLSIGLALYGLFLIVGDAIGKNSINKQITDFSRSVGHLDDGVSTEMLNVATEKMVIQGYGAGVASIVIGMLCIVLSRRLGSLIARGL